MVTENVSMAAVGVGFLLPLKYRDRINDLDTPQGNE